MSSLSTSSNATINSRRPRGPFNLSSMVCLAVGFFLGHNLQAAQQVERSCPSINSGGEVLQNTIVQEDSTINKTGKVLEKVVEELKVNDAKQTLENIKEFEHLFAKTDKTWRHGYHWFYGRHLAKYKSKKNLAILEIGANNGDSALAWPKFFGKHVNVDMLTYGGQGDAQTFNNPTLNCKRDNSNSTTDGDNDNCQGQIHTFYCDQSDVDRLKRDVIAQRPTGWDVIIDDGSHVPAHNVISFETLWKSVRPGGLYVIEDIETSYYPKTRVYGYDFEAGIMAPPPKNTLSRFRQYVDVINRAYIGPRGRGYSLFDGDNTIMEIGYARNVIYVRKALDGVDGGGKVCQSYPFQAVQTAGYASISTREALEIFREQSKELQRWITDGSAKAGS